MSKLTVTSLRQNIYTIVDKVIKTGVPVKFMKDGHVLQISMEKKLDKLANLRKRDAIVGDPEELIHLKLWEWNEPKNL